MLCVDSRDAALVDVLVGGRVCAVVPEAAVEVGLAVVVLGLLVFSQPLPELLDQDPSELFL